MSVPVVGSCGLVRMPMGLIRWTCCVVVIVEIDHDPVPSTNVSGEAYHIPGRPATFDSMVGV